MDNEKIISDRLINKHSLPLPFVAAILANIYFESAGRANNLQNNGNNKLGMTDEEFSSALNTGTYHSDTFIHDKYGYGLCQWTYWSRKELFYNYMSDYNYKFDDINGQIDFIIYEMKMSYLSTVYNPCMTATAEECAKIIMCKYERPADQSATAIIKRQKKATEFMANLVASNNTQYAAEQTIAEARIKVAEIIRLATDLTQLIIDLYAIVN